MLIKFETKTARVKGLSFHPKRPWVLTSLHNGSVQIWDYRMGTVIDTYTEHDGMPLCYDDILFTPHCVGPVRGCAFHPTQPLFATCGDDNKIRVFNFQQKKCLFTLTGHQDYIRSIAFHHESPWLMTASDDQTIRIWNWQSRSCVAQLTGHSHYVMCAQFHPREDLVVSCSLDQTIRVWDIAYLRRKGSMTPMDDGPGRGAGQIDLFATSDGQVKYVLEGHDRGVNWVSFHPTKPLIASGSDDRSVRIWRFNDSRAWETDCFRGHLNNVSCVVFHPSLELLLSASEDRSVRVWDYGKRAGSGAVQTFRRDTERYWMLAVHPSLGMFAAGHDGGLQLFKLERERPPQLVLDESLFFVRGAALLRRDVSRPEGTETALVTLGAAPVLPALLDYSPADRAFLVSSGAEYDLVGRSSRHGVGACAHFLAGGGRFAVLDEGAQLLRIRSVADGSEQAALTLPIPEVERAFKAPEPGTVLLASATPSLVVLWDVGRQAVLAELETPARIKRVSWSPDGTRCALLSRKGLVLTDQGLEVIASVTEHVSVKSAVWEPVDLAADRPGESKQLHILFYTTPHHLKYMLPSGETGIVCTTESPLYLVRVSGGQVWALDRTASVQTLSVDPAEWRFKLALLAGDLPRCLAIIAGSSSIVGQSVIGYLREHGYASLALRFVDDPQSCLELALECADWEAAMQAAQSLDRPEAWSQLASAAKRLGFPAVAQQAFAHIGQDGEGDALFLATLTGRLTAHPGAGLQAAMLRGDAAGLASALDDARLAPLAFLARSRAGLPLASRPKEGAEMGYATSSLSASRPVNPSEAAWPLSRPLFDYEMPPALESMAGQGATTDSLSPVAAADEGGWGQDALPQSQEPAHSQFNDFVSAPQNPLLQTSIPVLHLLAGSVESARRLLTQQAGIVDFDPLRPYMERIVKAASSLGALVDRFEDVVPAISRESLAADLAHGMALTTEGRFADAILAFESVLHQAPLAILQAGESIAPLISEARDYLLGLRMEMNRKELIAAHSGAEALPPAAATRILELACYFACCPLRPSHRALAARSAMTLAFRLRQLPLASRMAKRLLDLQTEAQLDPAILAQANKVMAAARQTPADNAPATAAAALPIQFDDHLDFDLDASSHTPLYAGQQTVACPYCHALYGPASKASVCAVCKLAAIDAPAQGLSLSL